jgi:UDP-N-acetylglucosamine 2-epimerase
LLPEEHNRIAVDAEATLLFCPDERSCQTLFGEGVRGRIEVVGDVMADACFRLGQVARERSTILAEHGLEPGGYVVATIHGEANVRPERLARILDGLERTGDWVLFPAHARTRNALGEAPANVLKCSTPSATSTWPPCVTARPSTEWVDTVELGANVLVDDDPELLGSAVRWARFPEELPPVYGDGHAAERVAASLADRG